MKFYTGAAAAVLLGGGASVFVESFSIQSLAIRQKTTCSYPMRTMAATSSNDDYFDSILGEGSSYQEAANSLQNAASSS